MGTHELAQKINPQKYVKLIVTVAGALLSALMALGITNGHVTTYEWINLAIVAVGAFQVWYITETSDNPNGKAVISFVTAGLITAQSLVATHAHLGVAAWAQILVAALTATGLLAIPSRSAVVVRALPASYANNTTVIDVGTSK